jgi:hypothetical protein
MKKNEQSVTIFIPVAQLSATWKGEFKKLPANKIFDLVLDYPFGGARVHRFPIKTGKKGMGLIALLGKIGQAYEKIYEDPDKNEVFGHDIDDLQLEGIHVNYKTKKITLDIGS